MATSEIDPIFVQYWNEKDEKRCRRLAVLHLAFKKQRYSVEDRVAFIHVASGSFDEYEAFQDASKGKFGQVEWISPPVTELKALSRTVKFDLKKVKRRCEDIVSTLPGELGVFLEEYDWAMTLLRGNDYPLYDEKTNAHLESTTRDVIRELMRSRDYKVNQLRDTLPLDVNPFTHKPNGWVHSYRLLEPMYDELIEQLGTKYNV